jgi:hypothetical protein
MLHSLNDSFGKIARVFSVFKSAGGVIDIDERNDGALNVVVGSAVGAHKDLIPAALPVLGTFALGGEQFQSGFKHFGKAGRRKCLVDLMQRLADVGWREAE